MTIFFTSDQHYWHKNVIEYCSRPFSSVEEMNEALIENHNAVVKPTDTIWMLGDFVFGGTTKITDILSRLNGTKHLVIGNHDKRNARGDKFVKMGFASAQESARVEPFLLSHFPYAGAEADARRFDWQLQERGDRLLHGHVHQHWKHKGRMINVGVDVWDFRPVALEELV